MPEPATALPDNPFWDFSLASYGRPGVAEACLVLQDRHGLDVNLLLLCCWAATQGRALDTPLMSRLVAAVAGWQREVVRPLRGVRRWLKTPAADAPGPLAALRQAVKAQELQAEHIEQLLLFDALGPAEGEGQDGPPAALAAANLQTYLALAGVNPEGGDRAALAALLAAAVGGLSEGEAAKLLA